MTNVKAKQANNSLANWVVAKIQPNLSIKLRAFGLDNLGLAFFCIFSALVFLVAVIKPEYNWDMAAYLASALQDSLASAEDLHAQVWSLMKANSSENQF